MPLMVLKTTFVSDDLPSIAVESEEDRECSDSEDAEVDEDEDGDVELDPFSEDSDSDWLSLYNV